MRIPYSVAQPTHPALTFFTFDVAQHWLYHQTPVSRIYSSPSYSTIFGEVHPYRPIIRTFVAELSLSASSMLGGMVVEFLEIDMADGLKFSRVVRRVEKAS